MARTPQSVFLGAGAGPARPPAAGLRPDLDVNRLYVMGRQAISAHQPDGAIEALERVISLQPDHVDALISLVHAHVAAGNQDDALALIAILRARKPDTPMADFEEARLLSDMGRIEEARALLERVTRIYPDYAPAWHALAKQQRVKPDDPLIEGLQARIAKTEEPSANMMFLCMGLAKAYDDIGEYDLAFDCQQRAKRQIPVAYDREEEELRFRGLREVFTKAFFAKKAGYGAEGRRPIFVIGMPRSGTSLTEQILASHPDVYGAGELDFMAMAAGEVSSLTPDNAPLHRAALKLGKEAAGIAGRRYLRRLAYLDREHARVVDKMPHNFLRVGLIGLILPNASIVHCRREPIDTCLSIYMQYFSQDHLYAHSLEALGHYYQLYVALMEHWREHSPIAIHDLTHAQLIADQRGETESLAASQGLSWDEGMMEFYKTERRVATPSRMQVRSPLNAGAMDRWRKYAHRLGPLIEALGPCAPAGL